MPGLLDKSTHTTKCSFLELTKQCFWPWELGVHCVEGESGAKLGYYQISQNSVSFLERMRTISLMVTGACSPAEKGMKYSPSPFKWEGRALFKILYLHFHPQPAFQFVPCSQIVQRIWGNKLWGRLYNMSAEFSLRQIWLGKAWMLFWTWEVVPLCLRKEPKSCRGAETCGGHLPACTDNSPFLPNSQSLTGKDQW